MSLRFSHVDFDDRAEIPAAAQALAPSIRQARGKIEEGRRLPLWLVEKLKQAGVFRMAMPRSWGGPELDLSSQLQVIEELSAADASVGWCVMINCDGGYFSALLHQDVAREMYRDLDAPTASSFGKPAGKAVRTSGGYRVSGRWHFSSGCQHSKWIVAGCVVYDGDKPALSPSGLPETRCCFMPADQCEILDTWYSTGLRGSGSNDFAATDLFVPAQHTLSWQDAQVLRPGPLYAFPLLFTAKAAAVPLGIARGALEVFAKTALTTAGRQFVDDGRLTPAVRMCEQPHIQNAFAHAQAAAGTARSYVYEVMGEVWSTLVSRQRLSADQIGRYWLAILSAFNGCVETVDLLYKAGGSPSVYANGFLDRAFRDIHTISQHGLVSIRSYEIAGRSLLGLRPLEFFL
jgi:alkylation response protein AidB-like acyl-CoA dehydrogenase